MARNPYGAWIHGPMAYGPWSLVLLMGELVRIVSNGLPSRSHPWSLVLLHGRAHAHDMFFTFPWCPPRLGFDVRNLDMYLFLMH